MNILDTQDIAALLLAIDLLDHPGPEAKRIELRRQLNAAYLYLNSVESLVGVSAGALQGQACELDLAVVGVLETAVSKLNDARERIESAIDSLPKRPAALAELCEALAVVQAKLLAMQGDVA